MINHYTTGEMPPMHFVYGLTEENSLRAMRLYKERYPNKRDVSDRRTFQRIHQRLH